jgi:hypothetical protein
LCLGIAIRATGQDPEYRQVYDDVVDDALGGCFVDGLVLE